MKNMSFKVNASRFLTQTRLLDVYMHSKLPSCFSIFNRLVLQNHKGRHLLKLHLGCGARILDGWINIDAIWRPRVVVLGLPKGLNAFNDDTIQYIYSCHLLEHLEYRKEALRLLKKCHQLLAPGGVMRLAVPDMEPILEAYVKSDTEFFRIQSQRYHPSWCTTKLEHLMYALQQDGQHKYGYDFETLQKALLQAGFEKVFRSSFRGSIFEELRIDYRDDDNLTLFVDAIKGSIPSKNE